jgi:micrococcal nuclease
MKKISIALFIAFAAMKASAQTTTIEAKDAAKHIGEEVTICDKIFSGKFLAGPGLTLLDVGGSHPNEVLSLVIKGDDRKKFSAAPEDKFKGQQVCVTGKLIEYKGKPEIMITDTAQIKLDNRR